MSRFFIDRPIFAWVIAIVIMLTGALAIRLLPIAQYPEIAPPAVSIIATYPGASAETLENTVTQPIEQQMNGIDHLEYLSSVSESSGQVTITLTFAQGTNPDIAQVQVQNKLQLATPLLPTEVQQQGVIVAKASRSPLLVMGLYSENGEHDNADLSDILTSKLQDPLSRVNGVGNVIVFGSPYAIRIWLDPYKLNSYALNASDVAVAVSAQNTQVAAGQIGAPPTAQGQVLNAIVNAQSRLQQPQQFRDIILRTNPDGSVVRLSDVARVEMGQDNYNYDSIFNGHPASGMMFQLAPGANALDTVAAVKARVAELASTLPPDVKVAYPFDTSPFVRLSIEDVVKTLMEAIVLVFLVMFVFLQNWRATLIPTIAVPVVLLGTFGVLAAFHYSINTLTMFGMVLAIGLLVDDAIVVVENVERIMREEGLGPREAARKSMDEITGALVGIVLVLSAVFLPMAFFGGSTGVIYRQFSVTIVSAMALSVLVALILTPALCATLLKPVHADHAERKGFFGWFNRTFDRGMGDYQGALRGILRRLAPAAVVYFVVVAAMALLFIRLPTGFLPDEDQGVIFTLLQRPAGSTLQQTMQTTRQVQQQYLTNEKDNVSSVFCIGGFSNAGQGLNAAQCFTSLTDWKHRPGRKNGAAAIAGRAMGAFAQLKDVLAFAVLPPPVLELGNATGFDFELEDRAGLGETALSQASAQLLAMARKDPLLTAVRANSLPDIPQLKLDIDQGQATALGVSLSDVNATLSTALGSNYIDDFVDRGRVKRVYAQADAAFRGSPDDLGRLYVRSSSGTMTPFSAFSSS
ncbi:MAG: efflux RND transporter permease subunit, partial [Caulobacteraceae bacterium]|nr:efflux RND transporter permease subunit [Caulobacteraceae bacterium]